MRSRRESVRLFHLQKARSLIKPLSFYNFYCVDGEDENKIHIKLSTKDFVKGEIVYKFFEGYWIVKEEDGKYKLWEPEIKEVKDPGYEWYWE